MNYTWKRFAAALETDLNALAPPGERRNVLVEMAETMDGVPIGMSAVLLRGVQDGPRVWLMGSIHGNEILATQAVVEVIQAIDPRELSGLVLAIPALNTTGFQSFQRESPYDGADMNRIWDKDSSSLGYTTTFSYSWIQRAKQLLDALKPHLLIDVHDGGVALDIMSHVLYAASAESYAAEVANLAKSSGMQVVWRHQGLFFGGSSVGEANARKIPGFIIESGGGGMLREQDIREMSTGVMNLLKTAGCLSGAPERQHQEQFLMTAGNWLRPEHGGVFHRSVSLGDRVVAGDEIGRVTNLFGELLESVTAPVDGIVFGIRTWGVCNVGDYVANVGIVSG